MAFIARGTLRIAIITMCSIAYDVINLARENDIRTSRTFEMVLVEALVPLFYECTFTIDVNKAMAKAASWHFDGFALDCEEKKQNVNNRTPSKSNNSHSEEM